MPRLSHRSYLNKMLLSADNAWGLILAGGDGKRLREFVRLRFNSERPKQFCAFHGTRSMLANTIARVRSRIERDRLFVTIRSGQRLYAVDQLEDVPDENVVEQPMNKETGPAILLGLLHVYEHDPEGIVAIFPADHFIRENVQFMAHVDSAVRYLQSSESDVVLIGAEAQYPETDYGWIEISGGVPSERNIEAYRIYRFWEKPSFERACMLTTVRAFWNTMVVVGKVKNLLGKFKRMSPWLFEAFTPLANGLGLACEKDLACRIFSSIRPVNFSAEILAPEVDDLVVIPARGVYWNDWGRAERIEMDISNLIGERETIATCQKNLLHRV